VGVGEHQNLHSRIEAHMGRMTLQPFSLKPTFLELYNPAISANELHSIVSAKCINAACIMDLGGDGVQDHYLTSGPFRDSMSAAARPKRWGVSLQAKGQDFNPTGVEISPYLTRRATKGT
jgi:hypothetical protein